MRNWRYDERGGMVAVYEGEPKNCLSLPDSSFVFVRYWERTEKGFAVIEEDKTVARLIAAAPRMLDALNGLAGLIQLIQGRDDLPEDLHRNLTANHRYVEALAAIAQAEGHV